MKQTSHLPIRLRAKLLNNGEKSLYLDIYAQGKRKYEFLKLYLLPETNRINKEKNRSTMILAESILAKRIVDFNEGRFDVKITKSELFIKVMEEQMNEKKKKSTYITWYSAKKHFEDCFGDKLKVTDITPQIIQKYIQYLENRGVTSRTVDVYLKKISCTLNHCSNQGLIAKNPCKAVKHKLEPSKQREFLTIEELRILANTPIRRKIVKQLFLFSCFTGLRFVDIQNLQWSNIEDFQGQKRIVFRQQKTSEVEYIHLSEQALALMGEPNGKFVFPDINTRTHQVCNEQLKTWAKRAGIKKHLSFHCARHTFAVTLLSNSVDIYTVSKLLGHKSVSTTMIYADIVDEKKREAINLFPKL